MTQLYLMQRHDPVSRNQVVRHDKVVLNFTEGEAHGNSNFHV